MQGMETSGGDEMLNNKEMAEFVELSEDRIKKLQDAEFDNSGLTKIGLKFKGFVFTWYKYPDNFREMLDEIQDECNYILACENCKRGRKYLRGYVQMKTPTGFKEFRFLLGNIWAVRAFKDADTNYKYCTKTREEDVANGVTPSTVLYEYETMKDTLRKPRKWLQEIMTPEKRPKLDNT